MSEFDQEERFIQTVLEAGRGGLGDLSKALHALKKASTISTIGDLDDIEIDNPQPDQVITYDGETGQWINGSAVAGAGVYQPVNGNLTALSLLDTSAGVVYQSSENLFGKRVLGTTANTIAAGDHTHTGIYAQVVHSHDATYAASTHYHDDLYSALGHNHDTYYITVVATPTIGNFPVLDASGELQNSTYGPTSFAGATRLVSTQHSLAGGGDLSADRTLSLLNDSASPGNNMVYGTTGVGVKGWKSDPAGAAHDSVTLAGTPDYITISGQVITRQQVDLAADVTGILPISSIANLATATETAASRTNTAADRGNWVRWTNTGAKTFTIDNSIASNGDVWSGINAAVSGTLTLVAGAGVTLTGSLGFAAGKTYTLRFSAASAADVVGGT